MHLAVSLEPRWTPWAIGVRSCHPTLVNGPVTDPVPRDLAVDASDVIRALEDSPLAVAALVGVAFYLVAFFRNLLFTGGLHWLFLVRNREAWKQKRLQSDLPDETQQWIDYWRSTFVFGVYAVVFSVAFLAYRAGYTRVYLDVGEYGWGYFSLSNILVLVVHDTYFYWTHRLLHWGPLMRFAHRQHHVVNPTPWTGFSMSATQAVVESLVFPFSAFVLPLHPVTILIWLTITSLQVSYAHLGYEVLPESFVRGPVGRWLITSSRHNEHHRRFTDHYGLFFAFWDVALKTNVPRRAYGRARNSPSAA